MFDANPGTVFSKFRGLGLDSDRNQKPVGTQPLVYTDTQGSTSYPRRRREE